MEQDFPLLAAIAATFLFAGIIKAGPVMGASVQRLRPTMPTIALAVALRWNGRIANDARLVSIVAIIPACGRMRSGRVIRTRIRPLVFRRVPMVFLLLLGLEMASRDLVRW